VVLVVLVVLEFHLILVVLEVLKFHLIQQVQQALVDLEDLLGLLDQYHLLLYLYHYSL
jgi:hypothetical protein